MFEILQICKYLYSAFQISLQLGEVFKAGLFLLQNIAKGGSIVVTAKKPGVTAGKFDAV